MKETDILTKLCLFDPRNPNNHIDEEDEARDPERKNGCYCDNCYYGRDVLANELLRVLAIISKSS